jgi:hypothetical protein
MRVRSVLIAVLLLALHGSAAAQGSKLVQVFVKVGGKVVQLLIEKKGELTVGVLAGTIVDVGKSELGGFFSRPETPLNTCTLYGSAFATCPQQVNPELLLPFRKGSWTFSAGKTET